MADICTSNGRNICEWAKNGQDRPRQSKYQFLQQSRPSKTVWNTWQRLLRLCYCTGSTMTLTTPLGKWYRGRIMQTWDTVIDPNTSRVYIWHNHSVRIYERQGQSTKQYRYLQTNPTPSFPIGCIPVSSEFQAGTFIINGYTNVTQTPYEPNNPVNDRQLMHHGTQCSTPLPTMAQAIWDGQAILATDGSIKNNIATYAWIISNLNDTIAQDISGSGLLPPSAPYAHHASK